MPVKIYRSNQPSAPSLSGSNGSLIALLDACLVNGYGQVNVSTLARVGNVVTLGFIAPHNFETHDWITLAGADQLAYNAEFQVTRLDAYQLTFQVAGTPDTPGTGEIVAKRAPAGFAKPFAGTNRAVYRTTDMTARRHYFRVLDDGTSVLGARVARIRGYERMTGVDDGELAFPMFSQIDGDGLRWPKSNVVDTSPRAWIIISDGKTVYMMSSNNRSPTDFTDDSNSQLNAFGEYSTFVPDAYASFVSGMDGDSMESSNSGVLRVAGDNAPNPNSRLSPIAVARNFTGGAGAIYGVSQTGHCYSGQQAFGAGGYIPYPNLPDNRYYMAPIIMYDPGSLIRAQLPGAYESLHGRTHNQGCMLENANVVGREGRRFIFLGGRSYNNSYYGGVFIDATGPWEV